MSSSKNTTVDTGTVELTVVDHHPAKQTNANKIKKLDKRRRRSTLQHSSLATRQIEVEPIHVPRHSTCCGVHDHHCRIEAFEIVESRRFQMLMLFLLCIDVVVVGIEIMVQYRILTPEGPNGDLDSARYGLRGTPPNRHAASFTPKRKQS